MVGGPRRRAGTPIARLVEIIGQVRRADGKAERTKEGTLEDASHLPAHLDLLDLLN
jgi:hypothetical protein